MRATLLIKNIGGLREGQYVFDSDKLNMIESANSAGKTSIVKALTAILSIPSNGALTVEALEEAQKLGIKTDPRNPYEGFVNVHANQGSVELEFDGKKEKYLVKQNGDTLVAPEYGDERFILAGILSNNSRVLRQLRSLDKREPDDFKWAVDELSYAQRYSTVTELLQTKKEDLAEKKVSVDKSLKQLEPLRQRQTALESELKILDSKLDALKDKFRESGRLAIDRDESLKRINSLRETIQSKTLERTKIDREHLAPKLKELKEAEALKRETELDLKKAEQEIALLKGKEKKKQEIEKEINKLMDERNTLDGLLNLYVVAETSFRRRREEKAECPLCMRGYISYQEIVQNISKYRKERGEKNEKILQLNQEKQNIAVRLSKNEEKAKDLRSKVRELADKIRFIEKQLKAPQDSIRAIDNFVADRVKELEKEKQTYEGLSSKISKADDAVNKEYNEKSKKRSELYEQLGSVRQVISELSSIDVYGMMLAPEVATELCKDMMDILNDRIDYLEARAEEERQEAAERFNKNISILMASLGFSEFRTIKLVGAPSYRLYVERFDPEKREYKSQDVGTLSTSEKLAIALILQIALKETYMKKLPFFILDDVLEGFDSERCEKVINYLREKVKLEDWFMIATRLVEELDVPRVKHL